MTGGANPKQFLESADASHHRHSDAAIPTSRRYLLSMHQTRSDTAPRNLARTRAVIAHAALILFIALGPLGSGTARAESEAAKRPEPPNVVILLADDLGWADVGYRGSDIETPSIDRLAETLDKFEEDILRRQPCTVPGKRAVKIRFGEPVPVSAEKKKGAARELTDLLEQRVQGLLDSMG